MNSSYCIDKVCICGAGDLGLSMAAHLSLNGISVSLWNRTEANIDEVIRTGTIHCSGIVNGVARNIKASSDLKEVINDFVMVTTPSSAHKDIAKKIAPFVHKNMIVILNPGRTFGAIEFVEQLKKEGVTDLPHIAETQTVVYTCRKINNNNVKIFALKNDVNIASLAKSDLSFIISKIPQCLKGYFSPVNSVAVTSFSNVGMILHCAPVLLNVGWIESDKSDFKYYYDGISKSISVFLEKLDFERKSVALANGYSIESLKDWLNRSYNINGETLYDCLNNNIAYKEIDAPKNLNTRYLFEDIPNGLVPIEFLGRELNVPTPNITTIIDLANSILDYDFRTKGRSFPLKVLKEYF